MTAAAFDTHAAVKKLQAAGFSESQAEAQADLLSAALKQSAGDLATKQDLTIAIAELKADLLKWIIGLFIAQVGLFAALVKLLH